MLNPTIYTGTPTLLLDVRGSEILGWMVRAFPEIFDLGTHLLNMGFSPSYVTWIRDVPVQDIVLVSTTTAMAVVELRWESAPCIAVLELQTEIFRQLMELETQSVREQFRATVKARRTPPIKLRLPVPRILRSVECTFGTAVHKQQRASFTPLIVRSFT